MHLRLFLALSLSLFTLTLSAQALLTTTDTTGGAYATISAAGFGIEGPDDSSSGCRGDGPGNHQAFGEHVTQTYDSTLNRGVFVFHSHIDEDNDRCVVFDRARMELKGGPAGRTDQELEHDFGDTTYYRWQFRLAEDFVGSNRFNHLFQNKAAGGTDSSFPVLTLTARTSVLQLLHNAGDENAAGTQGVIASASLDLFRGKWVEVYMRQIHTNAGALTVTITDVETGLLVLAYDGIDLDLWRGPDNATNIISRPKFGMYRSYNEGAGLKDEQIRFAQFCATERDAVLCPSIIERGADAPAVVSNILPRDGSDNVPPFMPLTWNPVAGATEYRVHLGTDPAELPLDTVVAVNVYRPVLAPATTYYFRIGSANAAGEVLSELRQFTTLANPDDGAWKIARGHAAPQVEASQFFELNTNLALVGLDSVGTSREEMGNNDYCWFSGPKEDGAGNYRWRYRQEEGEEVTLLLRLRALPETNNITYVEFYGLGWRQKLRINRNTLKFEKTPGDPEVAFPDGFWDDGAHHVLRITFAKNPAAGGSVLATVYLDEHAFPFGGPFPSDEEKEGSFLDVGRAGGTDYGSCMDYIAINPTGIFAPGDGAAAIPPADLTLPEPTVGTRWFTLPAPVLYPNPVRNKLLLRGLPTDQSLDYRILTVAGRELASGRVNSGDNSLATAGLPEGVYFLALRARDGRRTVVRFVKKGW